MSKLTLAVLATLLAVTAAKKFHSDASYSVSSSIHHYAGEYRPGQKVECYAKLDNAQVTNDLSGFTTTGEAYLHLAAYPHNGLIKYKVKTDKPNSFGVGTFIKDFGLFRSVRGTEFDPEGDNEINDHLLRNIDDLAADEETEATGSFWLDSSNGPTHMQYLLNNAAAAFITGCVTIEDENVCDKEIIRGQVICQGKDHADVKKDLKHYKTD